MGEAEVVDVDGGRSGAGAGASIFGVLVCEVGGAGVLGFAFPPPFIEGDHDSNPLAPPELPVVVGPSV